MNLCTEEQNLSNVLLTDESFERACSCTTQVLDINTEWNRDDYFLLLLCVNLEDALLSFLSNHQTALPILNYLVDTVHSHDSALHSSISSLFFQKKKLKLFV